MKLWRINYMKHFQNGEIHVSSLSVIGDDISTALSVAIEILKKNNTNPEVIRIEINQVEAIEHEGIMEQLTHRQDLCNLLLKTLRESYGQEKLFDLKYTCSYGTDDEYVIARWSDGSTKKINVSADSDIAMMKDVLKAIE